MTTDLHSLLAPYVLDALDPDEFSQFEAHLEHCPDCQAELGGFQATATRLAEAQSHMPPADLRQRLVSAIGSVQQERPSSPRSAIVAGCGAGFRSWSPRPPSCWRRPELAATWSSATGPTISASRTSP